MVSCCMVPGCSVRSRKGRQVSFHSLPKDMERCIQWLRVINHPKYSEDTTEKLKRLTVCSIHFTKEDFELNVLGMKRPALLDTAVPSVFTFPDEDELPRPSGLNGAKRLNLEVESSDVRQNLPEVQNASPQNTSTAEEPRTDFRLPLQRCDDSLVDDMDFLSPPVENTGKPRQKSRDTQSKSSAVPNRNGLMEDVVVKVACLLELFQNCFGCYSDACSITTETKGLLFHVVQQCWSCGKTRNWASHPPDHQPPDSTASHDTPQDSESISEDMEEEEEEELEDEEDEEDQEKRRSKRKRKDSDEEWGPSSEELAETSSDESEGVDEGEEHILQVAWCCDCGEEASARCFKQKHLQLYCCVKCGYRDGDQELDSTDGQQTQHTISPESPTAADQEGSCDGSQAAEHSCSPEANSNNKQTACSDPLEDSNSISSEGVITSASQHVNTTSGIQEATSNQGVINCDKLHEGRNGNQGSISKDGAELSNSNNSHGVCSSPEQGSMSSTGQGGTSNESLEDAGSKHQGANTTSQVESSGSKHQGANTTSRVESSGSKHQGANTTSQVESSGSKHQGANTTSRVESSGSKHQGGNTTSRVESSTSCHQRASAGDLERRHPPKYAVYFSDLFSLQGHVEHSHGHKRQLCPDCGKFINRRDGQTLHVCDHKAKLFLCLTCGQRCVNERGLRIHSHVHTEEYVLCCQYCYKKFRFLKDKQEHEETHKGESLKYRCSECPKRFVDCSRRNAHRKTHWEHGRFFCKVCDKGFPKAHHLQRHEVIHTGQKPFRCKMCDCSFNQSGHLKSHMRLHTGERPFKCQDCGQCFNHNVSLKNHIQRHHTPGPEGR